MTDHYIAIAIVTKEDERIVYTKGVRDMIQGKPLTDGDLAEWMESAIDVIKLGDRFFIAKIYELTELEINRESST